MCVGDARKAPIGTAFARQAVVLDVVDYLQRARGDERLRQKRQQGPRAQPDSKGDSRGQGDRVPAELFTALLTSRSIQRLR